MVNNDTAAFDRLRAEAQEAAAQTAYTRWRESCSGEAFCTKQTAWSDGFDAGWEAGIRAARERERGNMATDARWEWERQRGQNPHTGATWDSVTIADKPSRSIITGRNALTVDTEQLGALITFLHGVQAQIEDEQRDGD